MGTNMKRVGILAIVFMTMVSTTCNKRFDCANQVYSFGIDIKAYPDLDSIYIGDTVWLELNAPTKQQDLNSGRKIDYNNAENNGSAITFLEFVGGSINDPGVLGAANFFTFNLILGENIPNPLIAQIREYKFTEIQGVYKLKVGIVAHKKGIFSIAISNAANVYRRNDKCTKASFAIRFKDTDQHLYFLEQNRPGYTPSGLELTNMYCFKVI